MQPGIVGAGNMARAIAAGLNQPFLVTDSGSGRAGALALELGGEAVDSNEALAERCELLFLCHKPAQLSVVAGQLNGYAGTIVSALAATGMDALRDALPEAGIVRIMPNTPVALGQGLIAVSDASDPPALANASGYLEKLGRLETVAEEKMDLATAIGGCAPAFFALFARRLAEAGQARGLAADQALRIAGETLAGTGLLARERAFDMESIAIEVASPGGLTERALASFDENGLAAIVASAVDAALGRTDG